MTTLYVWAPPFLVGELRRDSNEQMSFQYDAAWIKNPKAFTLSFSLKLNKDTVYQKEAAFFFANLLPEGNAREALCRKIGISVDNDFELLKRIGRLLPFGSAIGPNFEIPQERFFLDWGIWCIHFEYENSRSAFISKVSVRLV